jgi:hypothetical protein
MTQNTNFNIKEITTESVNIIQTYEKIIHVPDNNGNTGIRYESKNTLKSFKESIRRTRNKIKGYIYATQWDYFVTLTLDQKKINRYSRDELLKQMNIILSNYKRINPDIKYILIPEFHKDKAIHLHGFIKDIPDVKKTRLKNDYGRNIYNWNLWAEKLGNTRLDIVPNNEERLKMYHYCMKYVTIEMMVQLINKKRYFASKGLPQPNAKYLLSDDIMTSTADYLNDNNIISYQPYDVKIYKHSEWQSVNYIHTITKSVQNP